MKACWRCKPAIVAFGKVARSLTGKPLVIGKARGEPLQLSGGIPSS